MATMFNIKINFSKIDKTKLFKSEKTGNMWGTITGCINDEVDDYGNNTSAWFEQTKEEKDAKEAKSYVGNGKAFWSSGPVTIITKDNPNGVVVSNNTDDTPTAKVEKKSTTESESLPF